MKFYCHKTPSLIKFLYPGLTWNFPNNSRCIYLTFDDGPDEDVTSYVLDLLVKYDAKATFFVVGQNLEKSPDLVNEILKAGHTIGNHTYRHLNGWKTKTSTYLADIRKCDELMYNYGFPIQNLSDLT